MTFVVSRIGITPSSCSPHNSGCLMHLDGTFDVHVITADCFFALHLGLCLLEESPLCCALVGCVSRWGGETALHSSSTVASSSTAASTSEEEGLHAALFLTTSASTSAT